MKETRLTREEIDRAFELPWTYRNEYICEKRRGIVKQYEYRIFNLYRNPEDLARGLIELNIMGIGGWSVSGMVYLADAGRYVLLLQRVKQEGDTE